MFTPYRIETSVHDIVRIEMGPMRLIRENSFCREIVLHDSQGQRLVVRAFASSSDALIVRDPLADHAADAGKKAEPWTPPPNPRPHEWGEDDRAPYCTRCGAVRGGSLAALVCGTVNNLSAKDRAEAAQAVARG